MPTFDELWANYPTGDTPPCVTNGQPNFTDQCAIRFGVCLATAGVTLTACRGTCCWYGHGRRHFLRAKQLAEWLDSGRGFAGRAAKESTSSHTGYIGKKGMVFFYKLHTPEDNWRGNHIDLWDGENLIHGDSKYFGQCKEVWFWPYRSGSWG
jgi:hypothetical protein